MKFFFLLMLYRVFTLRLDSFGHVENFVFWEGKISRKDEIDVVGRDERIGIFIYDVCGTRG